MMKQKNTLILILALLMIAVLSQTVTSAFYAGLIIYAGVLAIFALSINMIFGYLGYVTFGHAAFLGFGAYTAGILATYLGWSYWYTLPLAIVPGVLLGALLGLASLRLSGAYFAIASLTIAEILQLVAANWIDLTRGPLGLVVAQEGWLGMSAQTTSLVLTLSSCAILAYLMGRLITSPFGRAWMAIKQSLPLAESVGIPTLKYRVANLAISGGIASFAGFLLGPKIIVLTAELFGAGYSSTGLLAVALGGRGSITGTLIGAVIFSLLPEALRFVDEIRLAIFAVILLIVVRALPGGLISLITKAKAKPASSDIHKIDSEDASSIELKSSTVSEAGHPIMIAKGISKSFGGLNAVTDVNITVNSGEIVGLIGPNGAGKTTCLNMLSGYLHPDTGRVEFQQQDMTQSSSHEMAKVGIVRTFQQTVLFGDLPARENVLIATHLVAKESPLAPLVRTDEYRRRESIRQEAGDKALALVGLTARADIKASDLTYGEQRLLAIALALATQPQLLLLDEPAAGLNHTEATQLAELLARLQRDGLSILIIDHNLKMMMSLCNRVIVMHHGRKIADGIPECVVADPVVVKAYMGGVEEVGHA